MRKATLFCCSVGLLFAMVSTGICAYHHEGEQDANKFLSVYPDKTGTKIDHCALCHTGGSYVQSGKTVSLGSCQWCHYKFKYDGTGNILDTMNAYGKDYHDNGRNAAAVAAIENLDSDSDGYTNIAEIQANRFPGNPKDDPSKTTAPYRIYNRHQLEGMQQHTEFLLMNTSRSGDYYAQYTGVVLEDLLADAGITDNATGITVFSPDGWAQYHPLQEDPLQTEFYHIYGMYPEAAYYYDTQADIALTPAPNGWCDYSAPSCAGRANTDAIVNPDGNKVILAFRRESALLNPGILTSENKLDGEGPFRVVPPQKDPYAPDQSSKAANQAVIWPYNFNWDHNAGASTRTVTMIRIEPMPEGTTDIDILEAGWSYVDQEKVIIYGAIDAADANSNGISDVEEKGGNPNADYDNDGQKDFQDRQTARFRNGNDGQNVMLQAQKGNIEHVEALFDKDPAVPQTNRPANSVCPYGVFKYQISNLTPGDSVVVTMVFPDNIPNGSTFYKITPTNGWQNLPIGSNNSDNTITITLTDGDSLTDADGTRNGVIVDPGALVLGEDVAEQPAAKSGGGGGGCFIGAILP
jgi:hypothetical protein